MRLPYAPVIEIVVSRCIVKIDLTAGYESFHEVPHPSAAEVAGTQDGVLPKWRSFQPGLNSRWMSESILSFMGKMEIVGASLRQRASHQWQHIKLANSPS